VFTLDGVNSFAFSEVRQTKGPQRGEPKYTKWVIKRGKSLTLKGWHKTNEYVDQFKVTDFGESAAAKLGSASELGTITATFRASWYEGEDPPEGEQPGAGIGVGFGERTTQRVREDTAPREYGVLRAAITIRYVKP